MTLLPLRFYLIKNDSVTPMFYLMTADKKQHRYPLSFFIYITTLLPLTFYLMMADKKTYSLVKGESDFDYPVHHVTTCQRILGLTSE